MCSRSGMQLRRPLIGALLVASVSRSLPPQAPSATGPCSAPATSLQARTACFIQIRQYADSSALIALVLPPWIADKAHDFRRLHLAFDATPHTISRADRLRFVATLTRIANRLDTSDVATDVQMYDVIFASIERGDGPERFTRPAFAFLFLEPSTLLKIDVLESSINATSDTTATLYLTERATSPFPEYPLEITRRRTFSWVRVSGKWYLTPKHD